MRRCEACELSPRLQITNLGAVCLACGELYAHNFQGKLIATGRKEAVLGRQEREGDEVPHWDLSTDVRGVGGRSRGGRDSRVSSEPSVPIYRTGVSIEGTEVAASDRGGSVVTSHPDIKGRSVERKHKKRKQRKQRKCRRRGTGDRQVGVERKTDELGPRSTTSKPKVKKKAVKKKVVKKAVKKVMEIDKHYYLIMGGDRSPNHIE